LASFPEPDLDADGEKLKLPAEAVMSPFSEKSEREMWKEREREEEMGGLTGCREAVEILTRTPKKGRSSSPLSF